MAIKYDDVTITNSELVEDSVELTEILCNAKNLKFGFCGASTFKVTLANIFEPLQDKWLAVSEGVNGGSTDTFPIGQYKVYSDIPTADKRFRDIVAYDAMYDIINADVTEWYNTILPDDDSEVPLKEFRTSFLAYFGIEQEEIILINDDMVITRTVAPVQLSGKIVITAICEINGCFGHIGRNGKFQYIFLSEMSEGTYPTEETAYISAEYEDFTTARISKLQIRQKEGDIGVIYGTGDNCYVVQDNFLVYGKGSEELEQIAANLYSVISKIWYRPAHIEAKGNPCREVGDAIKISTTNADIYTYILQRTLKGIQALRDTYDAEGEQYQSEKVNSVHNQIIQLKGKTNVLERTIEETKLTISDVESGLQSQITQTAGSVTSEVTRATKAEGDLSNRIRQTADSLSVEITSLQNQIDGNIIAYDLDYVPTLTNYPAWDWTYNIPCNDTVQVSDTLAFIYKDEYYQKHSRTLAFNVETTISYRFLKKDGVWSWIELADSEFSYILQQLSELKLTDESITASVVELEEELIADYSKKTETQSLIQQMADRITLLVSDTYESKEAASESYSSLESKITQTAESIKTEVADTYETNDN